MGDSTKIEWTDATWNPVTGCAKVSQGCKHCYAERDWARLVHLPAYQGRAFADVACHPKRLDQPLIWRRPRRIFVNSMSDLFHPAVPFEFIEQVHEVIRESERHTFQILTKRPGRMLEFWKWRKEVYLANAYTSTPPRNAWYGVSVEDQATADERIPLLLQTPAAVRWISAEPLLGPVSVGQYLSRTNMPGLSMLPGFADPLPASTGLWPAANPDQRRGRRTQTGSARCATSARPQACHSCLSSGENGLAPTKTNAPSAGRHADGCGLMAHRGIGKTGNAPCRCSAEWERQPPAACLTAFCTTTTQRWQRHESHHPATRAISRRQVATGAMDPAAHAETSRSGKQLA